MPVRIQYLKEHGSEIQVVGVYIRSQHRNTIRTQELLRNLVENVDVAIIGAGWANHLTGCCDAFLRYTIRTKKVVVIGVAFADQNNEVHNHAAILSMTEVPGTQVKCADTNGTFYGSDGFRRACIAATKDLPEIRLPEMKPSCDLNLEDALELASRES